jgi:glutamate synthase domain-containing protein 2
MVLTVVLVALAIVAFFLIVVALYDLLQRKHAILRNFPIIGHFRYLLEAVGPELRQYIVTDNNEERPFSRDDRRWVYATAKQANPYFGFGTDNDLEQSRNYAIFKQSMFPLEGPVDAPVHPDPARPLVCAKVLGASHGRRYAFRPNSVVNVSGMSFGSLSGPAIEALDRGCAIAGALHTTGEGGITPYHLHGADLVWQIGTGYFGCRNLDGSFNLEKAVAQASSGPIKAIEIKLSQGAKPGLGGLLPANKVTPEIAALRGVPAGVACKSPAAHSAFTDVASLIDFVELLADATGIPVGIKSAVGQGEFWNELATQMAETKRGPDFITIDGGEGGTGAAPLAFSDHVALPFRWGFTRVYRAFAEAGIADDIVFIGSGKLGLPQSAFTAFALGCDMVNVGRTALFSIGCIQAQRCHTDRCPTGVATQNRRLARGLDPTDKGVRCGNYLAGVRFELERLSWACGVAHPAMVNADMVEILEDRWTAETLRTMVGYEPGWGTPSQSLLDALAPHLR